MLKEKLLTPLAESSGKSESSVKSLGESSRDKLQRSIKMVVATNRMSRTRPAPHAMLTHASALASSTAQTSVAYPPFPVSFAVAVCVDSFVDGFLIGISGASGASAGLVMSIALTIEMGFLGLTFALAVSKQPPSVALAAVIVPPVILILGGVGGTFAADGLSHEPVLHVGLISFGVSALLYLVTCELLAEAHSSLDEPPRWVSAMLFVGFVLAFLIQKAVDALEA